MAALLSFDWEFSHPVPGFGGAMQFGGVCVPWDEKAMKVIKHKVPGIKLKVTFPLNEQALVTDWVKENQAKLLATCLKKWQGWEEGLQDLKAAEAKIVAFLKRATKLYGAPITPCGWCLGSDMAYLLHALGEENDLVHYSAIDLKGMVIPLMKAVDPGDKETAKFLGVGLPENEHDALADAEYQLKLVLGAFKKIRE